MIPEARPHHFGDFAGLEGFRRFREVRIEATGIRFPQIPTFGRRGTFRKLSRDIFKRFPVFDQVLDIFGFVLLGKENMVHVYFHALRVKAPYPPVKLLNSAANCLPKAF